MFKTINFVRSKFEISEVYTIRLQTNRNFKKLLLYCHLLIRQFSTILFSLCIQRWITLSKNLNTKKKILGFDEIDHIWALCFIGKLPWRSRSGIISVWWLLQVIHYYNTGCPKKHGNSVTNWISSLLWFSIVIPNFKSHNIIMSARVYFMKRVKEV